MELGDQLHVLAAFTQRINLPCPLCKKLEVPCGLYGNYEEKNSYQLTN
jgi:hypothetical protein